MYNISNFCHLKTDSNVRWSVMKFQITDFMDSCLFWVFLMIFLLFVSLRGKQLAGCKLTIGTFSQLHAEQCQHLLFSLSFLLFATVLSKWDFSHGKFGLPSLGKASCKRVAQPYLGCMLGIFNVSTIHQTLTWTTGSLTCPQT